MLVSNIYSKIPIIFIHFINQAKIAETCHLRNIPRGLIIRIDIFPVQCTWNIFLACFQFAVF